jgi:Right handed beta helix region
MVSLHAGQTYYVSPFGRPDGDGSPEHPWDLAKALAQPSAVHPGDTIWLRGGIYRGIYTSRLTGTVVAPIIVRQYPGERATLDGGTNTAALLIVGGAYTWFWGFEIASSSLDRDSTDTGPYPTDLNRPYEGIANAQQPGSGAGTKFINLVVHNLGQGIALWQDATDAEIYGCLIYYNGWDAPDRGHGHGIYTQNLTGTRAIKDNIVFANYSHGLHAYGSGSAHLNNIWAEGNTLFQNGVLSFSGGRNLLIGGKTGNVAQNPTIISNSLYRPSGPGSPTSDFDLGFSGGCASPTVTNNYIADNTEFVNCSNITVTGNTFYGTVAGLSPSSFPSNTYLSQRPTGNLAFVRPNLYEPARANITVYNWNLAPTVSVDLTGVLTVGSSYEIRNAQDFFGAPVLTGTYAGGTLALPMSGLSVETPVGVAAPSPTGPEFNAFVLLSTGVGRTDPELPKTGHPRTHALERHP